MRTKSQWTRSQSDDPRRGKAGPVVTICQLPLAGLDPSRPKPLNRRLILMCGRAVFCFQGQGPLDAAIKARAHHMATAGECGFRWLDVPDLNPNIRPVSDFRRTIGGNIADLRRVGKSGSALSLPTHPQIKKVERRRPEAPSSDLSWHWYDRCVRTAGPQNKIAKTTPCKVA